MKKVLLTGVAGFIGAHTLEHLLENTNWFITGVDSLEHCGKMERVNQVISKNPELWAQRFQFIKADLAKEGMPINVRYDYIINMASESHVDRSISDPKPFVQNNVELTLNMLEYARLHPPEVFIQISTDEVYGPMYLKAYDEWDRLIPSNPYSASKACQEMLAISYWRTYGVPVVITNTMNNIGEMQDAEKFVPKVIKEISEGKKVQIHGTKKEVGTRFYLHARNHADALLFILNRDRIPTVFNGQYDAKPDKYNIVGDTQLNNLEMARLIAKTMNRKLDYELIDFHGTRPGHDMHYGLTGKKLEALGWKAPLSFQASLERTVKNYIDHPEWLK